MFGSLRLAGLVILMGLMLAACGPREEEPPAQSDLAPTIPQTETQPAATLQTPVASPQTPVASSVIPTSAEVEVLPAPASTEAEMLPATASTEAEMLPAPASPEVEASAAQATVGPVEWEALEDLNQLSRRFGDLLENTPPEGRAELINLMQISIREVVEDEVPSGAHNPQSAAFFQEELHNIDILMDEELASAAEGKEVHFEMYPEEIERIVTQMGDAVGMSLDR